MREPEGSNVVDVSSIYNLPLGLVMHTRYLRGSDGKDWLS